MAEDGNAKELTLGFKPNNSPVRVRTSYTAARER